MIAYLAWIVVSISSTGITNYGPPVKTVEDCQRMQKETNNNKTYCVQVNLVKEK
jgi:hypothetical protein